jgi:hypothetical protein
MTDGFDFDDNGNRVTPLDFNNAGPQRFIHAKPGRCNCCNELKPQVEYLGNQTLICQPCWSEFEYRLTSVNDLN